MRPFSLVLSHTKIIETKQILLKLTQKSIYNRYIKRKHIIKRKGRTRYRSPTRRFFFAVLHLLFKKKKISSISFLSLSFIFTWFTLLSSFLMAGFSVGFLLLIILTVFHYYFIGEVYADIHFRNLSQKC